jgi:flagellar assembly factor FliW
MRRLEGTRFGTIEFTESDIINVQDGMIGFEAYHSYVVVPAKPNSAFSWMQSTEVPALAFLVTDPNQFIADYTPEIADSDAQALELKEGTDHMVLVTTKIPPGQPNQATVNLAAPIVINVETRQARQIVLESPNFHMRQPIFDQTKVPERSAA